MSFPTGTLWNYQTNLNHMNDYIANKLKEVEEKLDKNKYNFSFSTWQDGSPDYDDNLGDLKEYFLPLIEQSLTEAYNQGKTDYHNHIVEKIDGLHKDEKEFIVELLKEHTGYSYTQAYNVAVDDCLEILEEIK